MSSPKKIVEAIFLSALDLSQTSARKEFLDRACSGDASLRSVVEAMLADHERAEKFFAKGEASFGNISRDDLKQISRESAGLGSEPVDEQIGRSIGPYKILQRIGEGGWGVVYMAEQERPIRRRVALKIIKLGMDTKSVVARFDAERQALALMDHPNIARVMDAGATETGRPFFVMELVRGVKVTDFCDQNNYDPRQRLELFIQICSAIQHAHQKGVIHRDIKPSNILVTLHDGVPVPKVIDFGIAKAIEGRLTEQTLFTGYEQVVGTPAYMSPEQAEMSGLDVDTRADIYSLGVLLYELLTGRTPFDAKELMKSGLDAMRRTLREQEPQRPSNILTTLNGTELTATAAHRHAEPPKLISLLKGDLDWIVMKTLEKDRKRRYETANALSMDVQRFLNNEPVIARPPSRWYRFQKLFRRNRILFLAGASVALTLLAGVTISTILFLREKEARRQQMELRVQAEQASRREAELRREAEANGNINLAAIYVSQGKYAEADALLVEFKKLPPKPSYDGVNAFRKVGEWLAIQRRWEEAADHFQPLLEIDQLDDWRIVTLDYQACGVVLAEIQQWDRYTTFCQTAIVNFGTTTNGDIAGRILKACLLRPTDKNLLSALTPLAASSDHLFSSMPEGDFPEWAAIPLSLWDYRNGDYAGAKEWCRRGLKDRVRGTSSALEATLQFLHAMSLYQQGEPEAARSELAMGRQLVDRKFSEDLHRGDWADGFWYDWVFAQVLLREATALIQEN